MQKYFKLNSCSMTGKARWRRSEITLELGQTKTNQKVQTGFTNGIVSNEM